MKLVPSVQFSETKPGTNQTDVLEDSTQEHKRARAASTPAFRIKPNRLVVPSYQQHLLDGR